MTPKDISIRLEVLTIQELLQKIETQKILLKPEEKLSLSYKSKSLFIESAFLNMPMMPIIMDGRNLCWTVIDGNKRLRILYKFKKNTLPWRTSKFISGVVLPKKYTELTPFMRLRFLNTKIPCYIINPGTPFAVAKEIKERYQTHLS